MLWGDERTSRGFVWKTRCSLKPLNICRRVWTEEHFPNKQHNFTLAKVISYSQLNESREHQQRAISGFVEIHLGRHLNSAFFSIFHVLSISVFEGWLNALLSLPASNNILALISFPVLWAWLCRKVIYTQRFSSFINNKSSTSAGRALRWRQRGESRIGFLRGDGEQDEQTPRRKWLSLTITFFQTLTFWSAMVRSASWLINYRLIIYWSVRSFCCVQVYFDPHTAAFSCERSISRFKESQQL